MRDDMILVAVLYLFIFYLVNFIILILRCEHVNLAIYLEMLFKNCNEEIKGGYFDNKLQVVDFKLFNLTEFLKISLD